MSVTDFVSSGNSIMFWLLLLQQHDAIMQEKPLLCLYIIRALIFPNFQNAGYFCFSGDFCVFIIYHQHRYCLYSVCLSDILPSLVSICLLVLSFLSFAGLFGFCQQGCRTLFVLRFYLFGRQILSYFDIFLRNLLFFFCLFIYIYFSVRFCLLVFVCMVV